MTFQFDRYTVRPVTEKDRAYMDRLIANDTFHAGLISADWFLKLLPGEGAWAVEDEQGTVALYFKTENVVRFSLQFGEGDSSENRAVLQKGMDWLEGMFLQNHFREVIFDTKAAVLAATAKRRLGFTELAPGTLHRLLRYKSQEVALAPPSNGISGEGVTPDVRR